MARGQFSVLFAAISPLAIGAGLVARLGE